MVTAKVSSDMYAIHQQVQHLLSEAPIVGSMYKYPTNIRDIKIRVVHPDFNIPDIGGIFVSCAMRIVSADGNPLNSATVEIMGQVGADYFPQADKAQNDGYLTGIFGTPAIGTGAFKLIPPDGTEKRLFLSVQISTRTRSFSRIVYMCWRTAQLLSA